MKFRQPLFRKSMSERTIRCCHDGLYLFGRKSNLNGAIEVVCVRLEQSRSTRQAMQPSDAPVSQSLAFRAESDLENPWNRLSLVLWHECKAKVNIYHIEILMLLLLLHWQNTLQGSIPKQLHLRQVTAGVPVLHKAESARLL